MFYKQHMSNKSIFFLILYSRCLVLERKWTVDVHNIFMVTFFSKLHCNHRISTI